MKKKPRAIELEAALANIDWQQVVANGGPPCFFLEKSRFCMRAERWVGHGMLHAYTPLAELFKPPDPSLRLKERT